MDVNLSLGDDAGVAGFYGKIASHGDFVTRRLPASFVTAWDAWLQEGFRESRQRLGPQWLDAYLVSPLWRFLLMPGVCGDNAWAGVLMPSVDRVGRHFPLTIAAGGTAPPSLVGWLRETPMWYADMEKAALSTLHDDLVFDLFDEAVRSLPALLQRDVRSAGMQKPSGVCIRITSLDAIADSLVHINTALADAMSGGCSLWWTDGSKDVSPCLVAYPGLPTPEHFTALLDGQWTAHGWQQHCDDTVTDDEHARKRQAW